MKHLNKFTIILIILLVISVVYGLFQNRLVHEQKTIAEKCTEHSLELQKQLDKVNQK
jgi:competence protein ComGC